MRGLGLTSARSAGVAVASLAFEDNVIVELGGTPALESDAAPGPGVPAPLRGASIDGGSPRRPGPRFGAPSGLVRGRSGLVLLPPAAA